MKTESVIEVEIDGRRNESLLFPPLQRRIRGRYDLKGAGIDYDALVRFLDHGTDVRLSKIEALAKFLRMRLTHETQARRKY